MSADWSGGFTGERPPNAKIPVKVHRGVALIRTSEAVLVDELLARSKLSRLVVGRLTDSVLLIRPDKTAEVLEELRRMGHTPQVIGRR